MTALTNRVTTNYTAPSGTQVWIVSYYGRTAQVTTTKAGTTMIYLGGDRVTKSANVKLFYSILQIVHDFEAAASAPAPKDPAPVEAPKFDNWIAVFLPDPQRGPAVYRLEALTGDDNVCENCSSDRLNRRYYRFIPLHTDQVGEPDLTTCDRCLTDESIEGLEHGKPLREVTMHMYDPNPAAYCR